MLKWWLYSDSGFRSLLTGQMSARTKHFLAAAMSNYIHFPWISSQELASTFTMVQTPTTISISREANWLDRHCFSKKQFVYSIAIQSQKTITKTTTMPSQPPPSAPRTTALSHLYHRPRSANQQPAAGSSQHSRSHCFGLSVPVEMVCQGYINHKQTWLKMAIDGAIWCIII